MDRPVVGEKGVRNLAQAEPGVLVFGHDGLVGAIAARQHEWPAHLVTEEVVERGVGEQQAEPRRACGDRRGNARVGPPPNEHDRACDAVQKSVLHGGRIGEIVR